MNVLRKTFGVLILMLIGIPTLLAMIWSVGVTRGVVSAEFLSDLPQDIIEQVPDMFEEVLQEVDREDLIVDSNERAWVRAIARADTSPKELLGKIGLLDWLENELKVSLERMGKMLRGEIPPRRIMLDMRPLKEALKHEAIKEYIIELLKSFPDCDNNQLEEWLEAAQNPRDLKYLPACRPTDLDTAALAIRFVQDTEIEEIPDEVQIFDVTPAFPEDVNMVKNVVSFTYLLFLMPAFFIIIGSLIGGTGRGGVFKWMGISTLIGGLSSLALATLVKNSVPWALGFAHYDYGITAFEELMLGKAHTLGMVVVDHIMASVNSVAGVVSVIGLVLLALSFFVPGGDEDEAPRKSGGPRGPRQPQGPQSPQPQPEQARPEQARPEQAQPQPTSPPPVTSHDTPVVDGEIVEDSPAVDNGKEPPALRDKNGE